MRNNKNTLVYAMLVFLLVITGLFSFNLYLREKTAHDKVNISAFPSKIMGWHGKDLPITEKEYAILETRNLISREYVDPSGEKIYLFIIYSETNRAVFHPPEVCLIGSGINIVDKKQEEVKFGGRRFFANKLYLEKGKAKDLVLYFYKAGNFYTDNFYFQQAYLALHQIFGKNVPGATIRLSITMKGSEESAFAALKDFLKETVTVLDKLS